MSCSPAFVHMMVEDANPPKDPSTALEPSVKTLLVCLCSSSKKIPKTRGVGSDDSASFIPLSTPTFGLLMTGKCSFTTEW
jgi:hypothetical protein